VVLHCSAGRYRPTRTGSHDIFDALEDRQPPDRADAATEGRDIDFGGSKRIKNHAMPPLEIEPAILPQVEPRRWNDTRRFQPPSCRAPWDSSGPP